MPTNSVCVFACGIQGITSAPNVKFWKVFYLISELLPEFFIRIQWRGSWPKEFFFSYLLLLKMCDMGFKLWPFAFVSQHTTYKPQRLLCLIWLLLALLVPKKKNIIGILHTTLNCNGSLSFFIFNKISRHYLFGYYLPPPTLLNDPSQEW